MNESNSIKAINRTNLTEQTKFRLDELSKIENYFHEEINQKKSCSKKLSKYAAAFDYIDKTCFKRNNWRNIYLFVYECFWSSFRNSKCKFYSIFFSSNRNSKKITKHNKKQKEKA